MNDNVFYEFRQPGGEPVLIAYLEFRDGMIRAAKVGRFIGFDDKGNSKYEEIGTPLTFMAAGNYTITEYRGVLTKSAESMLNEAKEKGISAAIDEETSPFRL